MIFKGVGRHPKAGKEKGAKKQKDGEMLKHHARIVTYVDENCQSVADGPAERTDTSMELLRSCDDGKNLAYVLR